MGVALRRAAHQALDRPPVFADPLALRILGPEYAARLPPGAPRLRAFLAVRSRYAEDRLASACERGARQYVLLGAGLDTFAYRNPHADLRVFEVDHPATQQWKRERLRDAGMAVDANTVFVAVDFERQSLAGALTAAGFRRDKRAFFSWLGVTPYITLEAFDATATFIASLPAGSGVVFDYVTARSALGPAEQLALDALAVRVAGAGEPFRLFFEPGDLRRRLRAMGFGTVEDLGTDEINARYFAARADGLCLQGGAGRLVNAAV